MSDSLFPAAFVPGTRPATVGDLRDGQWAQLFRDVIALQRVRFVDDLGRGTVRVEWDHGHGTKITVRNMPTGNTVQIAESAPVKTWG